MAAPVYRFGNFELIASRFELRRNGRIVKLERIPMDLLILLAERNGDVVTRPEIVERLWGKDIFVDTEHGINTAVRKIRTALAEDAERPRFVHTVPGRGYRLAIEHVEAPADAGQPMLAAPTAVVSEHRSRGWRRAVAAFAVVLLGAGVFVMRSQWIVKSTPAANSHGPIRSIAVLPVTNLSNEKSEEYFADGMTDELITMLAKKTSLRVISRTSVMHYKGVTRPLRDIARELDVDSILEGSVAKSATGVHLTLQLIDAATDTHLWADSFDRNLEGTYALSSSVADTIAKALGAKTSHATERRVGPEAHDAYLRGRYFWFADDYDPSQEYLEQAIQAQPDYAAAWSGLADVYIVRAVAGMKPPAAVIMQARTAVRKALDLDSTLPEAHNSLSALHLFYDWDFEAADREARRAIELNPNLAEIHHLRSYIMTAINRPSEALDEQKRSTELDPFARPWALGFVLMHLRQFDAAVNELRMRKAAQPHDRFVRLFLANCYQYKHLDREAAAELAEAYRLFGYENGAARVLEVFEAGGTKAVAEYQLQALQARARTEYVSPLDLAHAHARAGHRNETLAFLEAATRERSPFLVFLQSEPDFDFLHSDPRYDAIVRRIGLPAGPPASTTS